MKPKYIFLILCNVCIGLYAQKAKKTRLEELSDKQGYYEKLYLERDGDMEGTGYKDFIRQKRYAAPRLDKNGTFESYVYSLGNYNKSRGLSKAISYKPANWVFLGPKGFPSTVESNWYSYNDKANGKGQITSVWVDPTNHDRIFAGALRGGLWYTQNGGDKWVLLTGDEYNVTGIEDIIVNGSTIYVMCTMHEHHWGIARSTDGGESFEFLHGLYNASDEQIYPTTNYNEWPKKLALDPDNSNILYFLNYKRVFKSTDGGDTWDQVHEEPFSFWDDGEHSSGFYDIKILDVPGTSNNVVYVSGRKILRCFYTDNEWEDITTDVISTISPSYPYTSINKCLMAMDNVNYPAKIWFAFRMDNNFCVVKGDICDFANSEFQYVENSHSTTNYLAYYFTMGGFCISPTNEDVFYVASYDIYKFDGSDYTKLSDYSIKAGHAHDNWVHVDIRDMKIHEESGRDVLVTGDDGGVSRSTSAPASGMWDWEKISDDGSCGLYVTEFYGIASSEADPELIAGGCQDVNNMVYDNGTWYHSGAGDGGQTLIDPVDPSIAYMMHTTSLWRHNNRGKNTDKHLLNAGMYSECALEFDPNDHTTLYFGYKELTKIANANSASPFNSVICSSGNLNDNKIIAMAIAPGDPDNIMHVFTARNSGWPPYHHKYLRSDDGGDYWEDLSNTCGIPFLYNSVWAVTINPQNVNELWVGLSASEIGKTDYVYHSTDGGNSFSPLATTGYPAGIPVNDLEYDHWTNRLYAATDVGLFTTQGDGWEQYSGCIPYGHFTDIELNFNAGKIRAAVFGYGLWEASLQFCPDLYNRTLSGSIGSDSYYEAQNTITSTQQTSSGAKLHYAAQTVVLNPGFYAGELEIYPRLSTCNAECEEGCQ